MSAVFVLRLHDGTTTMRDAGISSGVCLRLIERLECGEFLEAH